MPRFELPDPEQTRRPEIDRKLQRVADEIGGVPTRCKRSLIAMPTYHAVCIDAPDTFKRNPEALRERLQSQLLELAGLEPEEDEWRTSRSVSRLRLSRSIEAVVHHKSAHVILAYQPSGAVCLSPSARERGIDSDRPPEGEFVPPKLLHREHPDYPAAARVERLEGYVLLGYQIDAEGRVAEVCLVDTDDRSNGHAFVQSAMDAALLYRYRPATLDGKNVAVNAAMTIEFYYGPRHR